MGLDEDRKRRLKATGKWFQTPKVNRRLWLNHIFPILLVIAFIFYVVNL